MALYVESRSLSEKSSVHERGTNGFMSSILSRRVRVAVVRFVKMLFSRILVELRAVAFGILSSVAEKKGLIMLSGNL